MVPREAMDAAQAAAVMVRVHGPDPKGRKMRNHAFHHSESGDTTLSASGLLLYNRLVHKTSNEMGNSSVLSAVVTCASIIEPFLLKTLSTGSMAEFQTAPDLIPGAEVDILLEALEQNICSQNPGQLNDSANHHDKHSSHWLPAKLVGLVDIPSAGTALQALLDAHGGNVEGSWEVGWALAPAYSSPMQGSGTLPHTGINPRRLSKSEDLHAFTGSESIGNNLAIATTRIAVLSICTPEMTIVSGLILAEPSKRGDFLLVVGSPFGALSPLHFFNSMAVGIVANCWPPESSQASLLMADVRCLPGMEGAPAFNEHGAFVGMLGKPLRQRGGGAEVQLVITWEALAPALHDIGVNLRGGSMKLHNGYMVSSSFEGVKNEVTKSCFCHVRLGQHVCSHGRRRLGLSAIDETVRSVVLVTVGDGAWASGILVNDKGLVLTNAHLLEPWRFGKTQSAQSQNERELSVLENATQTGFDFKDWTSLSSTCITDSKSIKGVDSVREHTKVPISVRDLDSQTTVQLDEILNHAIKGVVAPPALEINYRSYRKIRVRLEHPLPRSWHDARVVYISRGPLDIALLQLDSVPAGLSPIKPEEECPLPGTTAVVIGHGLFGPRSELFPSISAGVVSRVVKARNVAQVGFSELEELPAMLETTAAVHPGGSGGAVVTERGCMIGLVTSNARHSGGTVIPHLNFSIPYEALKPIFTYASGDMKDLSILSALGKPNERLAAVWALVPPTPPRPTQLLPFLPKLPSNDNTTSGQKTEPNVQKGSRFAKFLSEKKVELFKPLQPMQESSEQLTKKWLLENLPSKISLPGHIFHSRM